MNEYAKNTRWKSSSGLAFWGSIIQSSFSLIGIGILLYLIYNLTDILIAGIMPSISSMSIDYYENTFAGFIGGAVICFFIAFIGYLFYLIGICLFRGVQRSKVAAMRTTYVIVAELIMPAMVILFYVSYYTAPELIVKAVDSVFTLVLTVCSLSLAAVIIPLVEFNSLSKEETWSERSRKGADDLKFSYSCILWMLGVLIMGLCLIAIVVYSSYSKLQSINYDSYGIGSAIQGINSFSDEMKKLADTIKVIMAFVEFIMLIFALLCTIYRITGWQKIKSGGNEVVYQFNSKLKEQSSGNHGNNLDKDTGAPGEAVDSKQLSRISIVYEDEGSDKKKKWLLWGGIAVGVLVIAGVIWAVSGNSEEMGVNAKVYADRSFVFTTVEDGVGIEPIDELKYETEVECRKSELDKEGVWTKVAFEKDGKLTFGYMAKADLITPEESLILKKGGMSDNDARRYLPYNIERLALLDALKSSGEGWYLEGINKNGQQQPNFKRLYVKGVAPSETCFGFILRNNETNDRKFFLYSTPDVYSVSNPQKPVFLYFESVKGGDIIYDVNYYHYKKDGSKYEVIYVTNTETDNSDDFLYEGSAFEEEPEEMEKQFGGSVEMIGLVDGKYPVKMELTMHPDHSVTGTVTYTKYNVPMGLTGTYTDRDGSYDLSLDETSDGEVTGNFIGSYDGLVFSGTWVKPDGSKEMPFRVER